MFDNLADSYLGITSWALFAQIINFFWSPIHGGIFFFRCNDACCLRSLWEISLYEGENEVWKWIIFCFNALQTLFLLTPNYILRKLITLDNIMHQYENNKPHYVIDEMFLTNWISLHSILSCKYFSLSKKSSLYLKLPI